MFKKLLLALLLSIYALTADASQLLLTGVGDVGVPPSPSIVLSTQLKGWYQWDSTQNTVVSSAYVVVKDLSGNSFDLNGATGAQAPTVGTGQVAGHTAGNFTAANIQFMNTGSNSKPGIASSTVYMFGIIKPRANASLNVSRRWLGDSSIPVVFTSDNGTSVSINIFAGGTGASINGPGNNAIYAFTATFTATNTIIRLNRLAAVTALTTATTGLLQTFVGSGGGFGADNSADGYILEEGVASGTITQAQDDAIMNWLLYRSNQ